MGETLRGDGQEGAPWRHAGVSGSKNRQQNINMFMRQNRRISDQLDPREPGVSHMFPARK